MMKYMLLAFLLCAAADNSGEILVQREANTGKVIVSFTGVFANSTSDTLPVVNIEAEHNYNSTLIVGVVLVGCIFVAMVIDGYIRHKKFLKDNDGFLNM